MPLPSAGERHQQRIPRTARCAAIAAAVVGPEGEESELLRKVVKWSLLLVLGMCLLVYLQSTPILGWMVVA